MIKTKERPHTYTTGYDSSGPSTSFVVLISLVIIAILAFAIYVFAAIETQDNFRNSHEPDTTVPLPVPGPGI